jgi:endonuclease/exonuclease/phosphatase family metal-dependent hydrolase
LKKIFFRILFFLNVVVAAALALSYLAPVISPARIAVPAYFGLAYPYLLLANIAMVVVWAMCLKAEAFISVAVIAVGINHFTNYIKLSKTKDNKAGSFMVTSYNVKMFNQLDKRNANSESAILRLLKESNADIVCLQEVLITGNVAAKKHAMQSALDWEYTMCDKLLKTSGIMILSKYPVVGHGEVVHHESSGLTIYADVLIDSDTVRIYNNHLQSYRLKRMDRPFVEEIIAEDETMNEVKKLWVSLKGGFVKRSQQALTLKEHINTSRHPVIVAGDFNDTPISYTYRTIRKSLNDSFVNSGYGAGFTYRGNYPPNRIDYILYDKRVSNSNFEVLKARYSDHYPITAWFRKTGK